MTLSGRVVASGSVTYAAASGTAPTPVSIGESIDVRNCFIELSMRTANDTNIRLARHMWTPEFASITDNISSTIQFRRQSSGSAITCTLEWTVVELTGATVEHIEINPTTAFAETNIDSDADRSLIIAHQRTSYNAGENYPWLPAVYLTKADSQSKVAFDYVGSDPTAGQYITRVQIIQFESADLSFFERGSVTLSAGANGSIVLDEEVVAANSLFYVSAKAGNTLAGNPPARVNPGVSWADTTTDTLNVVRDLQATSHAVDVHYIVATIPGLVVRHGSFDAADQTSGTASIATVDTDRAHQLSGCWLQQNATITSTATTEHNTMFTLNLSADDTVSWARGVGTDFTTHAQYYQIVQWPEAATPGAAPLGNHAHQWW